MRVEVENFAVGVMLVLGLYCGKTANIKSMLVYSKIGKV